MKREYTFAWACWAVILIAAEFWVIPELRSTVNAVALAIFLVIEGVAVGRPKLGDTLSEHVWAFYGSKPARIPLIVGASLFFAARLYEIRGAVLTVGTIDVGRACLVLGVVGWIIPHFLSRGRLG